ncbi:MAG: 23S rRNA (guanosine(2251)-2'-O)-methyltransferase RlmB, partial [Acidobacteria bacterium]|nr:23S rRNA (guanosine(2251)-2'-O)-methyltransferase RlmB [Acidobacteriota bacterium]
MDSRICGVHAVYEALASLQPIERIHVARQPHSGRLQEILDLARERGIPVRKEERRLLDRMAAGVVHQGIIAVAAALSYADFEVLFRARKP